MVLGTLVVIIAIVVVLAILFGLISVGIASGIFVLMFADVIVFGAIIYLIYRRHKNNSKKIGDGPQGLFPFAK